jgi:hypothetical protein
MIRPDPLNWFSHEKTAAEAPLPEGIEEPYQIPREVSRTSLDPGERALAGILSVAGSISAKALPFIGQTVGRHVINKSTIPWNGAPIQGVGSIQEAKDALFGRDPRVPVERSNRVLGLFDIKQSHPPLQPQEVLENMEKFTKLDELDNVVDSFIGKHGLKEKGVRMNFQRGPLTGQGGGSYNPATKEVYLPHLGQEAVLHELGHAADYSTRVGRVRAYAEPAIQRGVLMALPIALAAGDRIKEMIPGTIDDKTISFMQDHAPGIMAATLAATTLYPEAKASITAIRHIRDLERLGRQPVGATMKAVKRLTPLFGSYLLGAVPAVVGMALARKYMNQAREEKKELQFEAARQFEKAGSPLGFMSGIRQVGDVASQLASGTADLLRQPHTLRRMGAAAKEVGTSPEFIRGALGAAVPATLGALYMYGTPGGEELRSKLHPETQRKILKHRGVDIGPVAGTDDKWRGDHPLRFAGLVAMGAALSGGILSKFISDLTRTL